MAKTLTELAAVVQIELGKVGDTTRITSSRCADWLNRAQQRIVQTNLGLRDVHVLDKTTWTITEDQYQFDLDDFSTYPVAHVLGIRYIDATNGHYRKLLPFPYGLDRWDARYPYIPNYNSGIPTYYQLRGRDTIEINVPFNSTAASTGAMWVDYDRLPYTMAADKTIAASPSGAVRSSNVVTITTTAAHGYSVGDTVEVGVTTVVGATSFDGTFTIASVPSTTTFTYASTAADDTGGAGTVGHYPVLGETYEEALIALAKAYGLRAMGAKFQAAAMAEQQIADILLDECIESEIQYEATNHMEYTGP